jgi:hypothetical protein
MTRPYAGPTVYPDDLIQNSEDRSRPPIHQAMADPHVTDHARRHQGGGPTGEVGGERPAEPVGSALAAVDGRDIIPGDRPQERGEHHWDAPLPVRVKGADGRTLKTLRDAGDFLSGRHMTLEHSAALQETARATVHAAASGAPGDVAEAGQKLHAYVQLMALDFRAGAGAMTQSAPAAHEPAVRARA